MPPNYAEAVKHCRPVGIVIAQFVNFLVAQGADLRGFHLIGFSLGGPVVAEAGRAANGIYSFTIPRITGNTVRIFMKLANIAINNSSI